MSLLSLSIVIIVSFLLNTVVTSPGPGMTSVRLMFSEAVESIDKPGGVGACRLDKVKL